MKINLPNRITLLRLILAIVFFTLLSRHNQNDPYPPLVYASLVMFVVAAVTDFLDGYFARKHNQVTALGRVLDPFVDKVLVCGAFVFLAGPGFSIADGQNVTGLQPWMVVVVLGRELLVTGLRGFSESQGVVFGAEMVGKAKMWIQSITVAVLLLLVAMFGDGGGTPVQVVKLTFVWLTVIITAGSLLTYLTKAKDILSEASRP
jgi:CDP-diacylglycerol--glycerol-3-phosphate 3-phosphatidyltransferase